MNQSILVPIFALALTLFPASGMSFDHSYSELTKILTTYVNEAGMVNYEKLKANRSALDSYLKSSGAVTKKEFSSWNANDQLAFLINHYNAETLQLIIDEYPVTSIKKLGTLFTSPWKLKSVQLFGNSNTLHHIEHEILRKDYNEPRIHFALVCAAISCPPLRAEAYVGTSLNDQLNDQARVFLKQNNKNRIEGDTLYLSSIFDWFKSDFTKSGKSINEYLNPFIDGDATGKKIQYTKYDWSLNKQ